eukprot:COSAG06_NODE_38471_length_423_cov_0.833333_1_plen_92_part_01
MGGGTVTRRTGARTTHVAPAGGVAALARSLTLPMRLQPLVLVLHVLPALLLLRHTSATHHDGRPVPLVVTRSANASAAECFAAEELARYLRA